MTKNELLGEIHAIGVEMLKLSKRVAILECELDKMDLLISEPLPQSNLQHSLPQDRKHYAFYSDGGARGNGSKYSVAAWACAFFDVDSGELLFEASEASRGATNNQMELFAAITALEALPQDRKCNVTAYLDSKYVIDGITDWVYGWVHKNWRISKDKPVKNVDYWKRLYELNLKHNVNWVWVKAHNGNKGNEYVDKLLNETMNKAL